MSCLRFSTGFAVNDTNSSGGSHLKSLTSRYSTRQPEKKIGTLRPLIERTRTT